MHVIFGIFKFQRRCFKLWSMQNLNEIPILPWSTNTFIEMRNHFYIKDRKVATIKPTNLMGNLSHLSRWILIDNRVMDSCPDAGPGIRSFVVCWRDPVYYWRWMGRHPDLGLMCYAKHRAAMWRSTLLTTLCTSTFTCAAALIDARLCINTQLVSVSWELVMCLANREFPIQSSQRFRLHKHRRRMWEMRSTIDCETDRLMTRPKISVFVPSNYRSFMRDGRVTLQTNSLLTIITSQS